MSLEHLLVKVFDSSTKKDKGIGDAGASNTAVEFTKELGGNRLQVSIISLKDWKFSRLPVLTDWEL